MGLREGEEEGGEEGGGEKTHELVFDKQRECLSDSIAAFIPTIFDYLLADRKPARPPIDGGMGPN